MKPEHKAYWDSLKVLALGLDRSCPWTWCRNRAAGTR